MTETKRPVGRPSKYDPKYCDLVLKVMGEGLSLTAFAGHIGVDRDTINEWRSIHPEFSVACKQGMARRTETLERGLLNPEMPGPAVNARRFALANAAPDEWREKQQLEHTGANGTALPPVIINLAAVAPRIEEGT